jgi:hypothetical protein
LLPPPQQKASRIRHGVVNAREPQQSGVSS